MVAEAGIAVGAAMKFQENKRCGRGHSCGSGPRYGHGHGRGCGRSRGGPGHDQPFLDWESFEDGKMVKNFKILICYRSNLNIQVPKDAQNRAAVEFFQKIVTQTNLHHEQSLDPGTTPGKLVLVKEKEIKFFSVLI